MKMRSWFRLVIVPLRLAPSSVLATDTSTNTYNRSGMTIVHLNINRTVDSLTRNDTASDHDTKTKRYHSRMQQFIDMAPVQVVTLDKDDQGGGIEDAVVKQIVDEQETQKYVAVFVESHRASNRLIEKLTTKLSPLVKLQRYNCHIKTTSGLTVRIFIGKQTDTRRRLRPSCVCIHQR